MKRSKKIISTILFSAMVAVLFWQGCDDNILDKNPSGFTEATFFNNQSDIERGIFGVYAKLSDKYWFNNNDPKHGFWLLPGDALTTQAAINAEVFDALQPTDGDNTGQWNTMYQIASRATIMLEKIDEAPDDIYQNTSLRDFHTGEVLFLRSYAYFEIWNTWGAKAPLIVERIRDASEANHPSSNANDQWGTEILDQVISDLTQAADLLPVSWDADNLGRVTSNSAYGLLGKALVFRASATGNNSDYTEAISVFDQIQDVSLVDNFSDNFSNFDKNNHESLFEFQASSPPADDNVWLSNDFDLSIGSNSAYWGFFDNHWSWFAQQPFIPTQKLLQTFEEDDPRADYTLGPIDVPIAERNRIRKYVIDAQFTQSGVSTFNNPRILRYADVLLLKAEALVQSGGSTTEAIQLINQVRERARNSGETPSDVPADRSVAETNRDIIMDWVIEERYLELAAEEGHRWYDLRRWHKDGVINLAQWDFSSVRESFNIQLPKHLFFPIPQSELDANQNIQQNEGY